MKTPRAVEEVKRKAVDARAALLAMSDADFNKLLMHVGTMRVKQRHARDGRAALLTSDLLCVVLAEARSRIEHEAARQRAVQRQQQQTEQMTHAPLAGCRELFTALRKVKP